MKHRASLTIGLLTLTIGTGLAACTGDDPAPADASSSSSSGTTGTSSGGSSNACSAASPCASGTCVDGYCCDSPCTGVCEACNVKGSEGKCSPATGKPLHGKCDGDADGVCAGSCDGKNVAACTYPEVACGTSSCAANEATIAATCKAGTCPAATTQKCVAGCFQDGCLGVKHLATGGYPGHACAVMTDGKVRCWGSNGTGQAGHDTNTAVLTQPTEVEGLTGVTMAAAIGGTTCVLLGDGTVKCFGGNVRGQLGIGSADTNKHPTPSLVSGISGATFISGGSGGTFCAIVTGGQIKCWGGNYAGQIGNGKKEDSQPTPVAVCAPGSTSTACLASSGATYIASGDNHACAIFANGEVACWGNNDSGACGQPPPTDVAFPKFIAPLTGGAKLAATALTAGNGVTCAVTTTGGAACWGGNGIPGRIGNCDTTSSNFSTPQAVGTSADCKTLLAGVTGVTSYDESVCGITNGAVKCWGTTTGGQLGDGNISASQSYAATTAIAKGAVQVTSGGGANYAVVVDGANRDVRCWGSEETSQCGTGDGDGTRATPVAPKW